MSQFKPLLHLLCGFIDNLNTTNYMRGYITAVLYKALCTDDILKDFVVLVDSEDFSFDAKVVDIPQFLQRKKGDNN